MMNVTSLLANRFPGFRRWGNRMFYQFLAGIDTDGEVTLMNYGYISADPAGAPVALDAADEKNRLCLQLYHHVASGADLRGKDVLEVGSGRGGGAAYVHKTFKPKSMTGVDYSERAVAFCQRTFGRAAGLSYVFGDAESLPFEDSHFDAAINVESSHCYGSMRRFLGEVYRVVKPGGHLLWVDFRNPEEAALVDEDIRAVGFEIEHAALITPNVLDAMANQGERYRALIDRKVPRFARGIFYHYAGVEGTPVLDALRGGELVYMHRVMVRPG